jgi:hypothetical protein
VTHAPYNPEDRKPIHSTIPLSSQTHTHIYISIHIY